MTSRSTDPSADSNVGSSSDAGTDPQGFAPDAAHQLVAECVERMALEGEAAIDAVCREHPELASTIRKRLEILTAAQMLPLHAGLEENVPDRLGEFRLLRRLGGGGMGVVYLACQESLQREVALKLIRPEHLYFPGARERFLREVEAVARLQHPGIVPVYTVGEATGIPYFAMERVAGCSLEEVITALRVQRPEEITGADLLRVLERDATDERSAAQRATFAVSWIEFCVRLIKQVAEALQHAHLRGVLHRDIKPSNIMVTAAGRALLLDFGLASTRGTSKLTRTGAQLGSLPYLAPEQLRGEQQQINERTDVYALGVTLYELLTLRSPFLARDALATRARILEADAIALKHLNSAVPWDVETVCLKAMERDPARRYASADEFARDLDNVLTLRPITAKRPGAWLRIRRMVQRHPARTLGVVLGFLLLVPVPTLLYLQQRWAATELTRSAKIANDERDHARQQRAAADRAIDFLVGLFGAPHPAYTLGHELTAKEILDQGAKSIAAGFESDPLTRARLLHAMGQAYRALGRFTDAEPFLTEALEQRRKHLLETDLDVLDSTNALGTLYRNMGRWQAAEPLLERAFAGYRTMRGDDDRMTLRCMADVARVRHDLGRIDEAMPLAREALTRRERALGEDDEDTVISRIEVSRLEVKRGDYATAEQLLLRALATCRKTLAADYPHTQIVLGDLGTVYCCRSEFERAEPVYRECLERCRRVFGDAHPETLVATTNLASVYYSLRRHAEAEALYRQAIERFPSVLPRDHVDYLSSLSGLGLVCLAQGQVEEARSLIEQALAGLTSYERSHPKLLEVKNNLALVYRRQGHYREAETLLTEVLDDTRRARGDDHPDLPQGLNNLASVYEAEQRYEEAEALYLDAWERSIVHFGRDHVMTVGFLKQLTMCYVKDQRYEEAEPLARELVQRVPPSSTEYGAAQRCLDHILSKLGRSQR